VILTIILLTWIGLPVVAWPPPSSPTTREGDSARGAAQRADEELSLEPGKPVERELSGGQSHFYKIAMTSGQYLRITANQQGIDALVALFAPDGKKIGEVDSEQATVGSETISAIAEAAGAYKVEVRSAEKTAKTGRYEIKVEELRQATAEDKYRVAAESLFREAEQLKNGTLEEKRKGIEKYQEALELYRRAGASREEAATLNDIGRVYRILGETRKALEKYNEALPIRRATGDRRGEADTLNNIGAAYQSLGETGKALEKFNEALPIRRATGDRKGEVVTLTNIGAAYELLGEARKALEKYDEALPIARAIGYRSGEATTLDNMGLAYQSLGEARKALDKFNEALPIIRAIGDRSMEGCTLHNIGAAYDSLGETQKALDKINEALSIIRAVGQRREEALALLRIAQVEQKRGNLALARQSIEQAISIIESMRANISGQELRASFFASRQVFYQSYIDVLMRMQRQSPAAAFDAQALEASERARARSLLELLAESRTDLRQGVDSSLLERERSFQQLLNAKAAAQVALLNHKHTPAQAEALAKEIASITTDYEELRAQIRARSPRYAALTQPQPLGLAEIQQQVLDPDTLLLEYSLGNDASYLFVVSQRSISWRRLPKRAEVEATGAPRARVVDRAAVAARRHRG
jgi:tetratricopeptide (TPR) repeat protein